MTPAFIAEALATASIRESMAPDLASAVLEAFTSMTWDEKVEVARAWYRSDADSLRHFLRDADLEFREKFISYLGEKTS